MAEIRELTFFGAYASDDSDGEQRQNEMIREIQEKGGTVTSFVREREGKTIYLIASYAIDASVDLAKEFKTAANRGDELGLKGDEYAFYEVLAMSLRSAGAGCSISHPPMTTNPA